MTAPSTHPTSVPDPGPIRPFSVPGVQRGRLANGLEIVSIPVSRLPLISVRMLVDVGEARLGDDRSGWAALVGSSLQGGTEARSGADLAEAIEGLGARIGVTTGWDATQVSLGVTADLLPDALDLLTEVVRRPAFPEVEVARARDQRLATIRQEALEPSRVAALAFRRHTYAASAAYHRPQGGLQPSVEAFTPEAARRLYDESYGPSLGVAVAGDVDPGHIRELMDERFGDWRGGWPRADAPPADPLTRERRVIVVDRPGAVQSELRIGHVGPSRAIPDYFALRVANGALGGTFGSRLNLNLRERHGFTYGVHSRLAFGRGPGPFTISTAVATDVTAAAVREAVHELEQLVEGGPTEDEVATIRDYLSGVFPLQMETTGQLARQGAALILHGFPDDHLDRYREDIRSVTRAQAAEAVQRHLRPSEVQIVVVGDAASVRGPLEELGLGPVHVEERS